MTEKAAASGTLTVVALAIDPQNSNVVAYSTGSKNYIFMLDLTNGARVHSVAVFTPQAAL